MNKMIDEITKGTMKNQNQTPVNNPSTRTAPYSRTTQPQTNVQQVITPQKQEQIKSSQQVGKLARHGKQGRHLNQRSPIRSKQEINEEQQVAKTSMPSQRTSQTRNLPSNKIQEQTEIKSNQYVKATKQTQTKQINQTNQAKIQSTRSSQLPLPPTSILYPKRNNQYKIKSNEKIEEKTPPNKSPQVKVQENTNYPQNKYSYTATNRTTQYNKTTQNQTQKVQEAPKPQAINLIQRTNYSRPNPYSKNPANTNVQQQQIKTVQSPVPIQKQGAGNRNYGKNVQQMPKTQQIKAVQSPNLIQRQGPGYKNYAKNVQQTSKPIQNQPTESNTNIQKIPYNAKANKIQQNPVNQPNIGTANKKITENVALKPTVEQQKNVQQNNEVKQSPKKPKVRSNMILYSLARIQNASKPETWSIIKQYAIARSRKFLTFGKVLTESTNSTSLQYLNGLKKHFFNQIKKMTIKQFKSTQKNTQNSLQKNDLKQQNLICWLIQALFKQKLRSAYKKLNNNRNKLDLVARGVVCLGIISKKKQTNYQRDFFVNLKIKANDKTEKISRMILCLKNYYIQRKKIAFSKLLKHDLPKPTKKALKKLPSVQKPITAQLISTPTSNVFVPSKQSVENIRLTIGQKKDQFLTEKKSYEDAINEFKIIVSKNEIQVSEMASRNQQLKSKLQSIRSNEQQMIHSKQQIDHEEVDILNKLTQIYIEIFKLPDDSQCPVMDLVQQHKLLTSKIQSDPSIQNWQLMLKHTNLKKLIENVEGIQVKQRKAAIVMQEQQKIIKNLIRSYVKQRYLWEWIRASLRA